jgi:hypothetical protein
MCSTVSLAIHSNGGAVMAWLLPFLTGASCGFVLGLALFYRECQGVIAARKTYEAALEDTLRDHFGVPFRD